MPVIHILMLIKDNPGAIAKSVKLFIYGYIRVKVKIKQSHYRPGKALRAPAG
jgi:hypothetical protein